MEEPVAEDNADNDYMTMDADTWGEQDDTYENGDTLEDSRGFESGHDSRRERIRELRTDRVTTRRPPQNTQNTSNPNTAQPSIPTLPNRYMTIRRPPMNASRTPGRKHSRQCVSLKCTTVCLVLLSFLLIGGLIGLGIDHVRLSGDNTRLREKEESLLEETQTLKKKIETLLNLSKSLYHVSSINGTYCSTGKDLFILNHDVLEEYMTNNSWFYLSHKIQENGLCGISYLCNMT